MDRTLNDNPQFKQGYLYAVRLLTASKKSSKELDRRLKQKGYSEAVIVQILDYLKEQGILSDQKLVSESVQWAKQAKRYGKRRIFAELKKKRIDSKIIESALREYSKDEERETAYALAEKRWDKLSKIEPAKRKQRLYQFLGTRGFDFEIIREVLEKLQVKVNENI